MIRGWTSTILAAFLLPAVACSRAGPTSPTGDGWLLERVATGLNNGLHSSLTTTSDDRVHLAFFDQSRMALRYGIRSAVGQWRITRLDSIGWVGRDVTIHGGAGDTLHLAYQDNWNDDLMYARGVEGVWTYERLNPTQDSGSSPMFGDSPEGLHLVDADPTMGRFRLRRGGQGDWTTLGDIAVDRATPQFGLALPASGPHLVVFSDTGRRGSPADEGTIYLISPNTSGIGWSRQTLVQGRYSSLSLAAIIDGDGQIHLLYTGRDGVLRDHGRPPVDSGVSYGNVRLRSGPAGTLWTLYPSGSALVLSSRQAAGGWERVALIQATGRTGRWDLHVDASGRAHVSFYSASQQALWYGRWAAAP